LALAEEGEVAVVAVTAEGAWRVCMSAVPDAPHGTGDLFAGVFAARWLEGRPVREAAGYAAGAVHAVVAWSRAMGADDLCLVPAQAHLGDPPVLPDIKTL
jgi:pyridoxine kinase